VLLRLSCSFVVDRPFLILQLKTQLASVELPDNFPPAPFGGARFFVRSSTRFNFVSDLKPKPFSPPRPRSRTSISLPPRTSTETTFESLVYLAPSTSMSELRTQP
jgi:hypothetical protein